MTLWRARARTAWALSALVLVAALVASLLGLHARVRERAAHELSRFGPNAMVVPADAAAPSFPREWARAPGLWRDVDAAVAVRETADGGPARTELLAGAEAPSWSRDARALGAAEVEAEDDLSAPVQRVAVRVPPERLDAFVARIERDAPGLRAQVVQRVAWAEARVLQRTLAFVLAASAVLLALCGLCFSSTLAAQWMERSSEIGLMSALGATRASIAGLFAREIACLAVVGGLLGGTLGSLAGWVILRTGFSQPMSLAEWPWWTVGLAALATCLVALAGGLAPLRRALHGETIAALRGA